MKVDILLRTRDFDKDYRWVFRPDYIDDVMEEKIAFLIRMMQKSELKTYLTTESLHNIYYIYDENGSVLVRSGFSGSMDRQGRNIYSVEGFACPAEMNRLFWYALPYLADWLSRTPMLREKWMNEAGEAEANAPEKKTENLLRQIDIEDLSEEDIFEGQQESNRMWQKIEDHSGCMHRLYTDVEHSADMYSLIYGTRPQSFYDGTSFRCYTPETFQTLAPVRAKKEVLAPVPVIDEADSLYRAEIQIEKNGRRYSAYLQAVDSFGEMIGETEDMTFGNDGIGVVRIERGMRAMDKKMSELGYRRGKGENR